MGILRFVVNVCSVVVAALAGNWVGGQVRAFVTGEPVQSLRFRHPIEQGRTIANTPVVTKFYPALVAARLGKPRWLFAFCGGVLAGALVGDRYEHRLWDVIGPAIVRANDARQALAN